MADLDAAAIAVLPTLSVTELYSNETAFRLIMQHTGVTREADRNHIVNDGFGSLKDIIDHHPNDVEGFSQYLKNTNKTFASSPDPDLRRYYSPVTVSRLVGVVHYYNQCVNTFHMIPDCSFVDRATSNILSNNYKQFTDFLKKDKEDDKKVEVPKLTNASNWVSFRDKFLMELSLTRGARDISLLYLVDDTVRTVTRANTALEEADELIDISDESAYVEKATHFGPLFKEDNKNLWIMLKGYLLGLPAYNHISGYNASNNGRAAWTSLKEFYEGEDFQERMRNLAFTKLANTFYRGETMKFKFENYVNVHKDAHKMLTDAGYNNGAGMDDATKAQHFKTGIKVDAGLEAQLSSARVNPLYKSFPNLVSFLSAEVEHKSIRKGQSKPSNRERGVSQAQTKWKGRGNGKGKKGKPASMNVDGKQVYAKRYSKEEFSNLSHKQRDAVIKLNRDARNKPGNSDTNNTAGVSSITVQQFQSDLATLGDAIVAGVSAAQREDDSVVDGSPPSVVGTESSNSSSGSRKSRATSGSVGDFIRRKRSRN